MSRITPQTGELYHVFNRGADKRDVFKDADDLARFIKALELFNTQQPIGSIYEYEFYHAPDKRAGIRAARKPKPLVHVLAHHILPNHIHLILQQVVDEGISEYMRRVAGGYTSYLNEKYEHPGRWFEGTYKRIHVATEEYLEYLMAYVNCNDRVHGYPRFAFQIPDHLRAVLSSRDQYEHGSRGICDTSHTKRFVGDGAFWATAEELADDIKRRRDLDAMILE